MSEVSAASAAQEGRATTLVALAYALLVLAICGLFFTNGMTYETGFPYTSQVSSPTWRGFFYWDDSLRIQTNTFYHLSYLLAELFRVPGSFVPYQIVYAVLWWARGFLVFLILRRILPASLLFCYAIGALVIVHASDRSLLWVGQLNQFGFIFWMLLAFYVFVVNLQNAGAVRTVLYVFLAGLFEYMSLWSYESQLPIILALPVLILLSEKSFSKRRRIIASAWYVAPIVYVVLSALRYFHSGERTYQVTVLRTGWSIQSLISDLFFNVWASLSVWSWNRHISDVPAWQLTLLAGFAALTFLLAGWLLRIWCWPQRKDGAEAIPETSIALRVLFAGALLLFLSFPVYLLLESARSLWRTQILSGPGAAMALAAGISLLAAPMRTGQSRRIVFFGLTATIVFFGTYCALEHGGAHRTRWLVHKQAMGEVIRAAPKVKPGTLFVLVNISQKNDPFFVSQWFDVALRLAYPGIPVAGTYFFDDQTPAPGANLILESSQWHWNHNYFLQPLVETAGISQTIVVEYDAHGAGRLLPTLPPYLCHGVCDASLYHPEDRIVGLQPSPLAIRRYGPF